MLTVDIINEKELNADMKEAVFYQTGEKEAVHCLLCPHHCSIAPGKSGRCRVRRNREGKLESLNYAQITSVGIDPIEKKPLYHFYPGSNILSVGTFGCNFHCSFCQNWEIAQDTPDSRMIAPEQLLQLALRYQKEGSIGIAYTYSEPLVWYEYLLESARMAREEELKNVVVTNGFIEEQPLNELLPYIDAMNIDVKGFTDDYYRALCRGRLAPVRRTVELAAGSCHVELTTLLVPGKNDSEEEIEALTNWVASISDAIPLHFSRYFPNYQLDLPPTPLETLQRAYRIASGKLQFVYLGNAWELGEQNTYCPSCHQLLIERSGYRTMVTGLEGRKCANCGREINIVV